MEDKITREKLDRYFDLTGQQSLIAVRFAFSSLRFQFENRKFSFSSAVPFSRALPKLAEFVVAGRGYGRR